MEAGADAEPRADWRLLADRRAEAPPGLDPFPRVGARQVTVDRGGRQPGDHVAENRREEEGERDAARGEADRRARGEPRERGRELPLSGGGRGFVTYHPSYLLRLPDEAAKAAAYATFVADLRTAGELAAA